MTTASPAAVVPDDLSMYLQNKFRSGLHSDQSKTDAAEPYVEAWERYAATYPPEAAFQLLRTCYPQLNFPVEEGINKTQGYIDAVLKGKALPMEAKVGLVFNQPKRLRFRLHRSGVGKPAEAELAIPVVVVTDEADFMTLVQCFLHKNNPVPVPASMGALLVNGINNWSRIHALKARWIQNNPVETWNSEFSQNILPNPGLYKDKLIVLSTKPYSNVPANWLGLAENDWADYSLTIRLEHECAHLYTLARYGCASNNLHDELVADYIGISKAIGRFDVAWMLTFMGLEDYPAYRKGARLENYIGSANLTATHFHQLTTLIKMAIESIAKFDVQIGPIHSAQDQACRMDALCMTDLSDMASAGGVRRLLQAYEKHIAA